jgi:hypothetical protein
MSPAEERALAWARDILNDAMEYPRAGAGWPHYSADEQAADVILRAAGLAWMLPACDTESPEQRAERQESEAAARAKHRAEQERIARERAAREQAEQAQRLEMLKAECRRAAPDSERRFGRLVDERGVPVVLVERWSAGFGRMSSLGGWMETARTKPGERFVAQDGRSIQPGEVLICPDDSTERLVGFSWNGRPTVSGHSSASSDWLPAGSEPLAPLGSGRIYPGQWEANRAWEDWDPYAQARAAKRAAKEARRAVTEPERECVVASPFASLASMMRP